MTLLSFSGTLRYCDGGLPRSIHEGFPWKARYGGMRTSTVMSLNRLLFDLKPSSNLKLKFRSTLNFNRGSTNWCYSDQCKSWDCKLMITRRDISKPDMSVLVYSLSHNLLPVMYSENKDYLDIFSYHHRSMSR